MMNTNDNGENSPEKGDKKVYTYQALIKYSNTEISSALRDVKDSKQPSATKFSFGTSSRDAEPKKFVSK